MTLQVTTIDEAGADGAGTIRTVTELVVVPECPVDPPDAGFAVSDERDATAHPAGTPDTTRREAAIEDMLQLLEASRRLQATLVANDEHCEASVRRMMDGTSPAAVLVDVDVARARLDLADTLGAFERARHRSRSTFIAAQFESGLNMKEIGRAWAISRQLAHRFFKEARRDG